MLRTFASLLPYLKRWAHFYSAGLVCLLVTNTGQLLIPQWLKAAGNPDRGYILGIVGWMVLTAVFVALGRVGWRFFLAGASRRIETELRQNLVDHLMTLPPSFYARQKTGELMARATNDLEAVQNSIGMTLVALTDALFLLSLIHI